MGATRPVRRLGQPGTMVVGSPDDCAQQVADAMDQANGRPIMIAPVVLTIPSVPAANLHAIRRAVEIAVDTRLV